MSEDKEKEKNTEEHREADDFFELSEEDLERLSGGVNLDHLIRNVKEPKGPKNVKKFKPRDGKKH
jgi:hypothetical protein